MKHFNFVAMIVVMAMSLVSCSRSPQDKAEALVAEAMKMSLYVPESYEPLATQIDSAFAPYASPEFHDNILDFIELSEELDECEDEMKFARSLMLSSKEIAHWSESSMNRYMDNKANYDDCLAKYNEVQSKCDRLKGEIYEMASGEEESFGYQIVHRFRADNNAGQALVGDVLFIVDKDFTQIYASYEAEDPDYETLQEAIEIIKENISDGDTTDLTL